MPNPARTLYAEEPIPYPRDEGPLDAYSRAVAKVVDQVGSAVVRVENIAKGGHRAGVGSGVIIAGDGLELTNSHVIGGAKRVCLSLAEGGETEAQLLGDDPDTDLALLGFKALKPARPELKCGTLIHLGLVGEHRGLQVICT
jgi:S1-C subfamily serine protease